MTSVCSEKDLSQVRPGQRYVALARCKIIRSMWCNVPAFTTESDCCFSACLFPLSGLQFGFLVAKAGGNGPTFFSLFIEKITPQHFSSDFLWKFKIIPRGLESWVGPLMVSFFKIGKVVNCLDWMHLSIIFFFLNNLVMF